MLHIIRSEADYQLDDNNAHLVPGHFTEWLNGIRDYLGEYFEYACDWYSFEAAYGSGLTATEAATEATEWLGLN